MKYIHLNKQYINEDLADEYSYDNDEYDASDDINTILKENGVEFLFEDLKNYFESFKGTKYLYNETKPFLDEISKVTYNLFPISVISMHKLALMSFNEICERALDKIKEYKLVFKHTPSTANNLVNNLITMICDHNAEFNKRIEAKQITMYNTLVAKISHIKYIEKEKFYNAVTNYRDKVHEIFYDKMINDIEKIRRNIE